MRCQQLIRHLRKGEIEEFKDVFAASNSSIKCKNLLLVASEVGSFEAVRFLISQGFQSVVNDRGERNSDDRTPLHWAAQVGDVEVVKCLLENGAQTEVEADGGFTPLHIAVGEGHEKVVSILLAHGADPFHRCAINENSTPLEVAIAWKKKKIIKTLKIAMEKSQKKP